MVVEEICLSHRSNMVFFVVYVAWVEAIPWEETSETKGIWATGGWEYSLQYGVRPKEYKQITYFFMWLGRRSLHWEYKP